MARETNKLSAPGVRALSTAGRHSDGGGLYLVVDKNGSKRWVFLFRQGGKLNEMGLGGLSSVTLAKARAKATAAREVVADGLNPIHTRKAARSVPTFGEMAEEVMAMKAAEFRREKSGAIWRRVFDVYAKNLRPIRVDAVQTEHVLNALKPIWSDKPESAQKARGCIEAVLDAAKAKGFRTGENPARWRGQLDHLLPKRQKLTRGHQKALPFGEVPAFVARLQERGAMAALALEFLILTAARSNEVVGALWDEVDMKAKVWTVPAARMKPGREHRVPLCSRAVTILGKAAECRATVKDGGRGVYVFPTAGKDAPLSSNALRALLIRLGAAGTAHGFRSSFRDWAGEASTFPRELAEAALAHTVGDATERAYRRGDALTKRAKLMEAWAGYIEHGGQRNGNVTTMARTA